MKNSIIALAVGATLLSAVPAAAQGQLTERPFALKDAMQMAVKHNPGLRAALELEVQAKAQRDQAFAFIQPNINAGYQYRINDREIALDFADSFDTSFLTDAFTPLYGNIGYILGELAEDNMIEPEDCTELAVINGFADCAEFLEAMNGEGDFGDSGDTEQPAADPTIIQPKTQQYLSLQADWPLSPRAISMAAAGKQNILSSRAQIRQARDQLLLGVVKAYAGAWQVQESVALIQEQIILVEAHLKDTQALDAAGMITRDVTLRAQLELEKIKRQLRDAQQMQRATIRGLRIAIGKRDLEIGALTPLPKVSITRVDSEGLAAEAMEQRPEVAGAEAQALGAQNMEVDAILQFMPAFAVSAQWNWSDQAAGFDDKQTSWWIGLGVQLPIWDGGIKVHNARIAASRKRQAIANIESVRQQVSMEVENAWDAFSTKRDAVSVAELERDLAAEAYRLVEVRYKAGKARQVEILDAQTALKFAELGFVQAQVDRELAAAELLAAAGRVGDVGG